jgi:hypothetical protein
MPITSVMGVVTKYKTDVEEEEDLGASKG